MTDRILDVYWDSLLVGCFVEEASHLARFDYEPDYEGYPISASMPVEGSEYGGRLPYEFLANLLPEIDRHRLARQYRVDAEDTFGLIGALGRECAGALQIVPRGELPEQPPPDYEPLADHALDNWLQTRETRALFTDNAGRVRLSLAGAQPKTALFFDPQDQALVPLNGAATSHILKPKLLRQRPNTAHIEYLCMQLARAVLGEGEVPENDLWRNHYRVRRYDRPIRDGVLVRIHQEDFCQALGESFHAKYEDADHPPETPVISRCMTLLDRLGDDGLMQSPAVERSRLLDRLIFNVLIHNADAHLKNYSLLYQNNGITVAPLYDVVCTAGIVITEGEHAASAQEPIRETTVTRDMGLRVGNVFDIRAVTGEAWTLLARQCGLTPRFVHRSVIRLGEALLDVLDDVNAQILDQYPRCENAIHQTTPLIAEQTAGVLGALQAGLSTRLVSPGPR